MGGRKDEQARSQPSRPLKRHLSDTESNCIEPHSLLRTSHSVMFRPYVRSDESKASEKDLCDRCRSIDFRAIFDIPPTPAVTAKGLPVFDLGDVLSCAAITPCKLCAIFCQMAECNEIDPGAAPVEPEYQGAWHLRAYTTLTLRNVKQATHPDRMSICLCLARGHSSAAIPATSWRFYSEGRGGILPQVDTVPLDDLDALYCYTLRRGDLVNFDRLQDMLTVCQTSHKRCAPQTSNTQTAFPRVAAVIDCRSRTVVPMTAETPFLALSYVAGEQSRAKHASSQIDTKELPEELPRTIEDAIIVTLALGYRYLWVDRYCISQSSQVERMDQIRQMANIYLHAYATICALGDNYDTGLPGVSMKRKEQLSAVVQDRSIAWTGPSSRICLQQSKWKTRGWTYQESVLSRRCLLFTDYDVVLICDNDCCYESWHASACHSYEFVREVKIYGGSGGHHSISGVELLNRQIGEYQSRNLTFQSDCLDAFKGILSQLPARSYWGIPIYERPETHMYWTLDVGFMTGLTWKTTAAPSSLVTNQGYCPSWSWLSPPFVSMCRIVPGSSLNANDKESEGKEPFYMARPKIMDSQEVLVTLKDLCNQHPVVKVIPEQTNAIELRSVVGTWTLQYYTRGATRQYAFVSMVVDALDEPSQQWSKSVWKSFLYLDKFPMKIDPSDPAQMKQKAPIRGFAILLCVVDFKSDARFGADALWMAVSQRDDGTYERMGLIECMRQDRYKRYKPREADLKSFIVK